MKNRVAIGLLIATCGIVLTLRAEQKPHEAPALTLVQTIEMPDVPLGPYADHPTIDVKGHRLFACAQAHKSVKVFDLDTGKQIHDLLGIENPHSVLYRDDINRIFVTDGGAGLVRIYDGRDYNPIKTIKLLLDADSTAYDRKTGYWYVDNGGKGAGLDYAQISFIDTANGEHIGDIRFQAQSLESIALEPNSDIGYISLTDKNAVAVFDRKKRTVLATWPLTKGRKNIPLAVDEARHLLYVGCRNTEESGVIDVLDTRTGREVDLLPIAGWVDDIALDVKRKRLYSTCGNGADGVGSIYIYGQTGSGEYKLIGNTLTAPMAKAGVYVSQLDSVFVAVPHNERTTSKILKFKVK